MHDLHVERQHHHGAEHRHADDDGGDDGDRHGTVAEDAQRDEGLVLHLRLGEDESDEAEDADGEAGDRLARTPAPRASLLGDGQQRHEADRERDGAPVVDAVVLTRVLEVQGAGDDEEGDDADRHVDEEDPAPAGETEDVALLGEEATDDGAEDGARREDGEEVTLVLGAFARRQDVTDDREGQRHEATGADALDGAERGKHVHAVRE